MNKEQLVTMESRRLPPMPKRTKTLLMGLVSTVLVLLSVVGYYMVTDMTYSTASSGKGSAKVIATIAFFAIFASFSLVSMFTSWLKLEAGKPTSPEKKELYLKACAAEKKWIRLQFCVVCVSGLVAFILYMVYC